MIFMEMVIIVKEFKPLHCSLHIVDGSECEGYGVKYSSNFLVA